MKDRSDWPTGKSTLSEQGYEEDWRQFTMAELMEMVWPLTVRAWAMKGVDISNQCVRRDIVRVIRRGQPG